MKLAVYTGTEVIFQCSHTYSHSGRLMWTFNATLLNRRVFNARERFVSGHHQVRFTAVTSHDKANIQCVILYQNNYNITSNVALLQVQGTPGIGEFLVK